MERSLRLQPAIIRCLCLTSSAIWNAALCVPGNVHSADGWKELFKCQGKRPDQPRDNRWGCPR